MPSNRHWTAEEMNYLERKWGSFPLSTIAQKLGRTELSVRKKAYKLRLGHQMDNGNTMSARALLSALGYLDCTDSYVDVLRKWMANGLPVSYKRCGKMLYYRIRLDHFWTWAEQHRDMLNFARFEEGALGEEPGWVSTKRARDARAPRNRYAAWTAHEDELLRTMLGQYSHTVHELAQVFQRSDAAIVGRITALGLKHHPIPEAMTWWTPEQEAELLRMRSEGYAYTAIAQKIGRSEGACRTKLIRTRRTNEAM